MSDGGGGGGSANAERPKLYRDSSCARASLRTISESKGARDRPILNKRSHDWRTGSVTFNSLTGTFEIVCANANRLSASLLRFRAEVKACNVSPVSLQAGNAT